jgi:hypothetical protein
MSSKQMAAPFGRQINDFVGVENRMPTTPPGLFDQRPGENPKKPPQLPVSSKMAKPFWLSSVFQRPTRC